MFEHLHREIVAHAREEAPKECVGVVYDGRYRPLENAHEDPEHFFRLSTAETALYAADPKTEAIVHSHPGGPGWPTAADMRQQQAMRKPWLIAAENPASKQWEVFDFGDHRLDLPLLEQPFRHGAEDCYTTIRRWWWQKRDVLLSEFPRDDAWWQADQDLYVDNFASQGFLRFTPRTPADLLPGDIFLFKLRSPRYNHAGVYDENMLFVHHAPGRLSERAPVGAWFKRADFWIRRAS